MRTLFHKHSAHLRKFLNPIDDMAGWNRESWGIRHDRQKGDGLPVYHVMVHMPHEFSREGDIFHNPLTQDGNTVGLCKAAISDPDGRWITIHPNGDNEAKGHPVFIVPNPDGSHTIVRGAGGALNGLRLTGVKSPEEYKHIARQRRDERIEAGKQKEIADRQRLGVEAYAAKVADKTARQKEIADATKKSEQDFIGTVLKAQGIDTSVMAVMPPEGIDPRIAERLANKHHQKLLTYARAVAGSVKEIVRDGLDQIATESSGEVGVSDLVNAAFGGGSGYTSPAKSLAADLGLNNATKSRTVAGFQFRNLLERNEMDVAAAAEKREQIQGRTDARRASDAKVKAAAAELGKSGQGPDVVEEFSKIPKIASMAEAIEILKAARQAQNAGTAAQSLRHEVEMSDDLDKLPRAAVVIAKPMSDDEATDAIADTLGQESMQHAMTRLVTSSNDIEKQYGTLRRHYSVGASLAFNTICQSVDGQIVDPMLHDILGTSGAAAVVAAGWRQSLGDKGFGKLKDVLAAQHIKTQEAIANEATDDGAEYLERYDALLKGAVDTDSPEGLGAAVQQHEERMDLIARARESLGMARGRLEATAAINEAMMQDADKPLQVSMGNISLGDALANCYALGLTTPTQFNKETGDIDKPGDFELSRDAENTVLKINPSGIAKMAKVSDPELMERSARTASIKSGAQDEEGWLPKGISDRPVTSYEIDPLERSAIDHALTISNSMAPADMESGISRHIGSLLNSGRDADDIAVALRSEEFVGSLNLSPEGELRYLKALNKVAPVFSSTPGLTDADRVEEFKQFQVLRQSAFDKCLDQHLAAEAKAGKINSISAGLDKQTLKPDAKMHDALYVAALADPRSRFSFHKFGDLGDDGRAAIRSYANEHLFGVDPKADKEQILDPLSDDQRRAYDDWRGMSNGKGDPYTSIQADWRKSDEDNAGLFGEPEIHPLASVDLTRDADVLETARKIPKMIGFKPMMLPDGKTIYPELEVGNHWVSDGDDDIWRQSDTSERTPETVAQDARGKMRKAIQQHWMRNMLGLSDLGGSGWSPTSVKTAGDRWGEYASHMGEETAYKTVQQFMAGDLIQRFAGEHSSRGGKPFQMASRPVENSEQHAEAMLTPKQREGLKSKTQSERASLLKRAGGRWVKTGSLKDKEAIAKVMQREQAALFADGKENVSIKVNRATIGRSAEATLAGMLPHMDTNNKTQAASGIKMGGQFISQQRATKLFLDNKRMGIQSAVGGGKSLVAIGAFTHARAEGNANRAIVTVPSNIVEQFSDEVYKFHDPSTGLRWAHTSGMNAEKRRAALYDPSIHMVITTPEALREDVTAALAAHKGVTKSQARDLIMSEDDDGKRNAMIHASLDHAGMDFDFCVSDEGHRTLGRLGKPDAHMARVIDAVSSKSKYFGYMTADPIKNDSSEAHSMLSKIDPKRYNNSTAGAFQRRYGRATIASGLSLQQEMAPYSYAGKYDLGIDSDHQSVKLSLTPGQQAEHDGIFEAYKKARAAKRTGDVDVIALKRLSPNSFKGNIDEEAVAKNLNKSLSTLRDAAFARVIDSHQGGAKENAVSDYVGKHKGEPTVVFCHSLAGVANIAKRLKAEGHRVGTLTGSMTGKAKNAVRLGFNPGSGDASIDVLVSSDAGAAGVNLPRGQHLINVDVPMTSMIHQQRIGRILRPGQKASTVCVRDLVADTDYDMRARRRLETKGQLRELTTSPVSAIDDSGLGNAIEQAGIRDVIRQAKMGKAK